MCSYTGNGKGIGVYVGADAITKENDYFELTILNTDMFGAVSIGKIMIILCNHLIKKNDKYQ